MSGHSVIISMNPNAFAVTLVAAMMLSGLLLGTILGSLQKWVGFLRETHKAN